VEVHATAAGKKVALVNLGCAKNLVDAEVMLGKLYEQGYELTLDPTQADYLIVNTCGFIQSAKEESIDHILEMAQIKAQDTQKKLVVTGCLAQRYGAELLQEMPEIDVLVGTGDFQHLPQILVQLHTPLPQRAYLSNDVYLYQENDARIHQREEPWGGRTCARDGCQETVGNLRASVHEACADRPDDCRR